MYFGFFFFNDTATTEIYTLSLHDALPISRGVEFTQVAARDGAQGDGRVGRAESACADFTGFQIGRAHV